MRCLGVTPRISSVAWGCHWTIAMLRLSLSFQIVHDGVVASVTTRYATRFCGPTTWQLSTVELNCVNWNVTLSCCIERGGVVVTGSEGSAPNTEGAVPQFCAPGCLFDHPPWV